MRVADLAFGYIQLSSMRSLSSAIDLPFQECKKYWRESYVLSQATLSMKEEIKIGEKSPWLIWKVHPRSLSEGRPYIEGVIYIHTLPKPLLPPEWATSPPSLDMASMYTEAIDALEKVILSEYEKETERKEAIKDFDEGLVIFEHDEFEWIESFSSEILKHRGKWVALSSKGVVAVAETMREARDIARENGLSDPLIIDVPTKAEAERTFIF